MVNWPELNKAAAGGDDAPECSIVVPLYNEAGVVEELHRRIAKVMDGLNRTYEIVFVNDGSQDATLAEAEKVVAQDDRLTLVDLRRNFGQTTALQAGLDHARGRILITMDGDLQHDPSEIPLFLAKIDEGYDIASGWRRRRADNFIMRKLPSRIANLLLAKLSGVELRDFGTTFKAYRREVLEGVRLYGDMHRFIPAVCARMGAKVCEVPIKNIPRKAGKSNYGISRTFRVMLDLITLRFLTAYLTRPLHFFGKGGMGCIALGGAFLLYGLIRKIVQWNSFDLFATHGPLLALAFMLVLAGLLFISSGVIGEFLMRIYFESTPAMTYRVRRVIRKAKSN